MPLVNVNVHNIIVSDAIAALAFAGNDQSVLCASVVQLQGSITGDDIANHTFEWEQTFGTPITLINPNTLTPSFVNPQVSDIEITLYIDRNTPYEDSDTVFISRGPQDAVTFFGEQGTKGLGGTGAVTQSNLASTNVVATDKGLRVLNPAVYGYSYSNPPEAKYSPIFKASDLDRVRKNVKGAYWLMNDIDLSDYDNWDPIGTATKPFSGELQGNGFKIENMTITDTPVAVAGGDILFGNVSMNNDWEGTDEDQFYTGPLGDVWTFDNQAKISSDQAYTGNTSLYLDGTGDRVYTANGPGLFGSGDFTIEFWARPDTDDSSQWICSLHSGANNSSWYLQMGVNNTIRGLLSRSGGADIVLESSINTINELVWTHITFMRNGVGLYLFANGVLVDSDVGTLSPGETAYNGGVTPTVDLYIGRRPGSLTHFGGYIDNFRLTKSARYPITGFAPPTSFPNDVQKNAGLFSSIGNDALIENVGVTNANISGVSSSLYKGILAGSAQGPTTDDGGAVTVRNSYVEGTIDSDGDLAGGLIGHTGANAGSTFENTYADVTVTGGGTDTGGWAGTFSGTPTYVENYGNTTKTASVVGTGAPGGTEVSSLIGAPYTGWDFVNIWDADSISGDPFYDGVSIFADFNGTDEDTTYTDETSNVWTFHGAAKLDNGKVKYGTTSFTRGTGTTSDVDYADIDESALSEFGTGDWTIEFWIYHEATSLTGGNDIFANYTFGGPIGQRVAINANSLVFQYASNATDTGENKFASFASIGAKDLWHHVVIQRNTTGIRAFSGGVQIGSTFAVGADHIYKGTGSYAMLRGGAWGTSSNGVWIDDFRITVGTARYATGGFTPPATANEFTPPSFATLQFDTNNNIRIGGFCDDQWMVQWGIPTYSGNNIANPPAYIYKGAIVEQRVAGGWSLPRFIPPERNAALMTPDTPHRITAVWDVYYNTSFELRRFPSLYTAVKEVGVTDDRLFISQNTSDRYGIYGTDSYTIVNGSAASSTNFSITIANPRKIAKTENELTTVNGGGAEATQSGNTTLLRVTPIQKPTQDTGTIGGAGSASYSDNLIVTRVNGASIG